MDVLSFHLYFSNHFGDKYSPGNLSDPVVQTPIESGIGFTDNSGMWIMSPNNYIYPYPEPEQWVLYGLWNSPIYSLIVVGFNHLFEISDENNQIFNLVVNYPNKESKLNYMGPVTLKINDAELKEIVENQGICWYSSDFVRFDNYPEFFQHEQTRIISLENSGTEH